MKRLTATAFKKVSGKILIKTSITFQLREKNKLQMLLNSNHDSVPEVKELLLQVDKNATNAETPESIVCYVFSAKPESRYIGTIELMTNSRLVSEQSH